ncbi:hypothetical protein N0V88_005163 [Collariella sp. IMI 366227]|nr:hypothetical protein N0V88_005163 [Collariella sp. IMI 366227]
MASYSSNWDCTYQDVPLLAFAIALCQSFRKDMPIVIKTLLSLGAPVNNIPPAFYSPLHQDIPDAGVPESDVDNVVPNKTAWYTAALAQRFAQALNFSFTVQYVLHLASRAERLSAANKKLARVHKASALLGIRYFLVCQTMASRLLTQRFLTYLAMPIKQPLIMFFAGPSGHGKTELARSMGQLLLLDLEAVDCTNLKHETDLFGPFFPFAGADEGSAVNNYLASHNAQRGIVFMDEFEKTKDDVCRALLVPFQNGEYRDHRNLSQLDCSKTIWILATNAFDQTVLNFCDKKRDILFGEHSTKENEETIRKLRRQLSRLIQKESIGGFGVPLTGRMTDFIPFLPFSPLEQAAVADKYLAGLGRKLTKRMDTREEPFRCRPVGNTDLHIKRGYSVCKALAKEGYDQELGARSIKKAIADEVRLPLLDQYLASKEESSEDQPADKFLVGVDAELGLVEVSQFALE